MPRLTTAATRRPHGSGRVRPAPRGELNGPPPVARQIRSIVVRIDQLDDGRWRIAEQSASGWSAAARSPGEIVAVIRRAFTEAQVAAYSKWRGHRYDGDGKDEEGPAYRRSRPISRGGRRCDVYDPRMWRLDDDGVWVSPRGHRYGEGRWAVQRVIEGRRRMGLSSHPDPLHPDPPIPAGTAVKAPPEGYGGAAWAEG